MIIENKGYCYTCDQKVVFSSQQAWLRDWYKCSNCGSIPRERALMYCIEKFYPQWKQLSIHESSPGNRGASIKLKNNCPGYQTSQYFSGFPLGAIHSSGWRNEDLENQTFADESFDLVISQDVVDGDITYGDTSMSLNWIKATFPKAEIVAVDRSLYDQFQVYVFLRRLS